MSDLTQCHEQSYFQRRFPKICWAVWNVLYILLYALYNQMSKAAFCSTQNTGWDFSLAHYGGDKIPLNWYRLWNMSCLFRLPAPLPSNFKALFSSGNILRALHDAIVLLAGRCHVGHRNANRLHAHAGRCHAGRSLRRRFAAARLLRLWVRIPLEARMSVCCE
jgi:hypothetical protein